MHARPSLPLAVVLGTATLSGPLFATDFEYSRISMGTKIRIVLVGDDEEAAARSAESAFRTLDDIERELSDWMPTSRLSLMNAAAGKDPVELGRHLSDALPRATQIAELTRGSFDPTVGPVVALWRDSMKSGRLPDADALDRARRLVDYRAIEFVLLPQTDVWRASLLKPGMKLDLGGIGKGYSLDQLASKLVDQGFERFLLDFGSSLRAAGPPSDRSAWRIDVPQIGAIDLLWASLGVSGDEEQHVDVDGRRWSHIVDPRTGIALTNRARSAVIADDAATADALSTALCVMGPRSAVDLLASKSFPGVAAWVSAVEGDRRVVVETPGFAAAGRRGEMDGAAGEPRVAATRRVERPGGMLTLEIAVLHLRSAQPGLPALSLAGIAHIGSSDLYRRMQEFLDPHTVVMYESVMPISLEDAKGLPADATQEIRRARTEQSMTFVAELLERVRRRDRELPSGLEELTERMRAVDSRLVPLMPLLWRDAWGNALTLEPRFDEVGAPTDFVLKSFGADGVEGGRDNAADITTRRPLGGDLDDEGLQADLAEALGLEFQLRAIDYSKANWRCADMTMEELAAAMDARGVDGAGFLGTLAGSSFSGKIVKVLLGIVKIADGLTGGAIRDTMKVMMIEMLGSEGIEDLAGGAMDAGLMKVILEDRNAVVIEDFAALADDLGRRDQPASVAIFYGAAHIPDLARRLQERFGYEVVAVEWIPAIEVDLKKSGITRAQLVQMRKMVKQAVESAKRGR